MLKVTVISDKVTTRNLTSKRGKEVHLRLQEEVVVYLGAYEVRKLQISLGERPPYAPGSYTLDLDTLVIMGQFGLEIDQYKEVNLIPVNQK